MAADLYALILQLVIAMIMGAVFSGLGYLRQTGENWQKEKMFVTVIIGFVIGALLWWTNVPVTEATLATYLLANGGLIVAIEYGAKAVYRRFGIEAWLQSVLGS
ncbi:MAG: hypothetical protein WC683_07440 [bacterium]